MPFLRPTAALAALIFTPLAACAQEFNSAPPNASNQTPAFEGQTRAPAVRTDQAMIHRVVASGLEHPWGLAMMPDGRWLVTEKPGRLRIVTGEGQISEPVQGLPRVDARGQGGLLDVVVGPNFANDRMIYWSYAEPREGGNATSVARGVLSDDGTRVSDVRVIFRALPVYDGDKHFGSSLAFAPDGKLFITRGERSDKPMRPQAQDLGSHMGKTIRINADGTIPQDNPFVGREGARPEIFSYGHRNVQGLAFDTDGSLWASEFGEQTFDELNRIEAGSNYGWPVVSNGDHYDGTPIPDHATRPEFNAPEAWWTPVIAPAGLMWSVVTESPSLSSTRAPSMSSTGVVSMDMPSKYGGLRT